MRQLLIIVKYILSAANLRRLGENLRPFPLKFWESVTPTPKKSPDRPDLRAPLHVWLGRVATSSTNIIVLINHNSCVIKWKI
uniref:Uncharacterized protein n=1 Tax=Romanomermis culicivorax TaxID=13658 RepID=A0A915KJU6_ROMCU